MFHVAYISVVILWERPKTTAVVPGPGPKTGRCVLKSSQNCTLKALPLVQSVLYLILDGYSLGTPELVYSDFQPLFVVFYLIRNPPFHAMPHTNAEERGDPLHPSHPKPRCTSNTRICLQTSAEIHTYYTWIPSSTVATGCSASAAAEIEVGSICPMM